MSEETSKIPVAARQAIMRLVEVIIDEHREARECQDHPECKACRYVSDALELLDNDQRQFGPPIDVTDPSWIRDHAIAHAHGTELAGPR